MDYIADMYKKNIYEINYELLKAKKIKYLLFDLDNTLATVNEKTPNKEIINFLTKLKKDFTIVLISNSLPKRVRGFGEVFNIKYYPLAMKPTTRIIKKIIKDHQANISEIAIIGDQLMTDITLGKKMGIYTILVDSISKKDFKITSINRYREKKIFDKLYELKQFERGKYYDRREIL